MEFRPFTYDDTEMIVPYLQQRTVFFSDVSLGYIAMWKDELNIRWCIENETLYLAQDIGDNPAFFPPSGKDFSQSLNALVDYVRLHHLPLRLFCLDEEMVSELRNDPRFSHVTAVYDERWSDYVYTAESACTYRGKKLSGQRNHVNRYTKLYGTPDARLLSSKDIPLIRNMLEEYKAEHEGRNLIEEAELKATYELLDHFEKLHQIAAGLFVNDQLIAFSIGEVIGNMLDIHVEKALLSYKGAYPTMYQSFVRLVKGIYGDLELVNREDDSGDPGLRTSKNQYHPLKRLHKYFTNVNAPDESIYSQTVQAGPVILTPMRESDRTSYYRLCTDPEISRWWGYDYENDFNITSAIDENLFYDMTQFDMAAGESVNFAVRETEDGEMIGEVILWNMTFDGFVEIGCRLDPSSHGKGYGSAAFAAAVSFVRDRMKRIPRAKCYKENTASKAMILSGGLSKTGEDDTFFYFE